MATSNLIGLITGVLFTGLFLMSMLSGYILLTNNEGRGEIFDNFEEFENLNLNLQNNLTGGTQELSNININLSSNYNPELSISAADQSGNAMASNSVTFTTEIWNTMSIFMGLIFGNIWTGTISVILISLLIFLASFYFVKFIRSGN